MSPSDCTTTAEALVKCSRLHPDGPLKRSFSYEPKIFHHRCEVVFPTRRTRREKPGPVSCNSSSTPELPVVRFKNKDAAISLLKEERRKERIVWSLMREMREKRLSEIDEWNRRPRGPKPKTPPRVDEQRLLSTTESYEIGQRAKKKIDKKKKDEGQSLARTLACNAGLVQRHSLDEVVRRRRLRESEEVRRRTARERDAQHESQMRARAARESTVEARRLHRRMSRVLMLEKTTSNSLSSSRKFKEQRPWTNFSSLFDGETNKKEFMKKRLSKYAEDRWMDKALARSVEHFGPTPNFRVLDGSAHFFS